MKQLLNCILVIDDDEPTNFFTHMIIEESGCAKHIKLVQSGQEALEYLIKSEESGDEENYPVPDLIFLDINMPAMNGWEFLDEYKRIKKTHEEKVIIVMLTTSLFPEDKAKANDMAEISGFENKPLTADNFEKIVSKHFEGIKS
jgi:CheY-like chemotaxis protein